MAFLIKLIHGDKITNSIEALRRPDSINRIEIPRLNPTDLQKEINSIFSQCGWKESDLLEGIKKRAVKSILKATIHSEKARLLPNLLTKINWMRRADNSNKKYTPKEIVESADSLERDFPLFYSREIVFILKFNWRIKNPFNEKLILDIANYRVSYDDGKSDKENNSIFDRIHAAVKRDYHRKSHYF